MIFKLLTRWRDGKLVCCCPIKNKCLRDNNCEELDFDLHIYGGIKECMREHSYKRGKGGAIRQKS